MKILRGEVPQVGLAITWGRDATRAEAEAEVLNVEMCLYIIV